MQLVAVSYDVSDRKHIEQELRQERQLLRTLIDAIPSHIFFKNSKDRFLLAKPVYAGRTRP